MNSILKIKDPQTENWIQIPTIKGDKGDKGDKGPKGDRGDRGESLFVARTSSDMINPSYIYLYVGSQSGYTFGDWYYYNGSTWISGGVYGTGAGIDDTLSVEGKAADAKATGNGISLLKSDLKLYGAYENTDNLLDTTKLESGLLNSSGVVVSNASYYTTEYIPISDVQTIHFQSESSSISTTSSAVYFVFYDSSKTVIGSRDSVNIAKGNKSATFQSVSGTAFVRVSYYPLHFTDVMIYTGTDTKTYEPYLALKSEIAKSSDLEHVAELPTVYNDAELTEQNGVIRTNLTVYFPDESYTGRYVTATVSEGEKVSVSGYSLNSYYPCAFVKLSTGSMITLVGGTTNTPYSDEEITLPANSQTIYVNGKTDTPPIFKRLEYITQAEFNEAYQNAASVKSYNPKLKCVYKNNILYVKKKKNATKDLVLSFGNVGGNNLFNFSSAFIIANNDDVPSDDFLGANATATWTMSGTDWLGPYKIEALQNADGDNPTSEYFTGGNHRTTNTGSGGGVTATQNSLSIFVDGINALSANTITACDSVTVKWKNTVQAYNTSKADGTGRGVLTESWEMKIDADEINLSNDIEALEGIKIGTYYGLQASAAGKSYCYIGGSNRGRYAIGTDTVTSGNNTCRTARLWDSNFQCEITVDPVDLGLFADNNDYSFFVSSTKLYASLIAQREVQLADGDFCYLRGKYKFT